MQRVGKEALRDVPEDEFYARLGEVRQAAGDRAVLRAIHVYEDNKRVRLQLRALENDNFPAFLEYVKESGDSSWMYLQNVIPEGRTARQEVAFALAAGQASAGRPRRMPRARRRFCGHHSGLRAE